jgi:RNA polymerase sigma-70 factor (ECF subfamily)
MAGVSTMAITNAASSLDKATDAALLASIGMGNKRAMEGLFLRYNQSVYRFVFPFVRNAALAEEIVGEVFLAVWRQAASFQAKSKISTWLLAIARNRAIESRRRRTEEQLDHDVAIVIVDQSDDAETQCQHVSRSTLVKRCLMQLSPRHREVLDLIYYHDRTVSEVALILGIPEGTVKTRTMFARRRLAELLELAGVNQFEDC